MISLIDVIVSTGRFELTGKLLLPALVGELPVLVVRIPEFAGADETAGVKELALEVCEDGRKLLPDGSCSGKVGPTPTDSVFDDNTDVLKALEPLG